MRANSKPPATSPLPHSPTTCPGGGIGPRMVDGEGDDVPGVDQWLAVVGDRDTEHPRLEENLESRSSQMPHARLGAARDWTAAKGPATTTVLLRHGETPLTAEGRFSGLGDVPLTDAGHGQATAAAARLAAHHRIELIVTSPLRRARDTADAVARATRSAVRLPSSCSPTCANWPATTRCAR